MATTPVLVKPQSQVNIDTGTGPGGADDQFAGHIAGLPDGGYVIVYFDASRHNSFPPVPNAAFTGAPAGAIQKYGANGEKTSGRLSAELSSESAITVLPDGNIAVGLGPKGVEIFTPALNLVRTDTTDNRTITVFADGSYAVAYPVGSGSDTDIVGRIVSPTGVVGSQFDIDNQTDNRSSPKLATLSNGNFVAVYQDQFDGSATNTDIRYGIFSPSGAPVAGLTSQLVSGASGLGAEVDPDVAALINGGFVVVWADPDTDNTDIHATILTNNGGTVAADILVNTTTAGVQDEASVIKLLDGGFVVTWEDDSANFVRAQRFDEFGHKVGVEFTVKDGTTSNRDGPEAALLSDGRFAYAITDHSTGDADVVTSIWSPLTMTLGPVSVAAKGDHDSDGRTDYIWRDPSAAMTMWEYNATLQKVSSPDLGTFGFSWVILGSNHFTNASTTQMLVDNTDDGTMALWWVSNGQLTGANIGQNWTGIASITNGDFTNNGAGIADFLVTNLNDKHLYNWWIDADNHLQGIDLGAAWNNVGFIGTGKFTANGGTNILVNNTVDNHLYDWWIDPASNTLQGYDLGAYWSNIGFIAAGKFTTNGGGNDNFLVFNTADHHLYDWWIDPSSHTLQGYDLGAYWSNIQLLASGRFDNNTTGDQLLVRNTVDNHLYEWWIDPVTHTLSGIDLGQRWSENLEIVDNRHFNDVNGNSTNNELLVRNTADGHFYEWWIANNQLAGADLGLLV